MGLVELGMRVMRGPDWRWGEQDGGIGHAGTIVEVGRSGSSTSPDKTVVVQWDSGSRTNYRVGYQSAFDLRLFDNAPIGTRHHTHTCDGCSQQGILGIRWKCCNCRDYDLCTLCYMADRHELDHCFIRYDDPAAAGVKVAPRKGSLKLALQGIFVGAKVARGPDWDWGNQDGGEDKYGRVLEIRGWDCESGRSVANVVWQSGSTNVYRVGHKGKVDLKCQQPAVMGNIYSEHLPIVGKIEGENENVSKLHCSPISSHPFAVGDRVRVVVSLGQLKAMQEGHGGWNGRMAEYINKVGTVRRITDKGDVRVQYEECPSRWTIHPGALAKAIPFAHGDIVQISDDINKVKEYQKGHGEWVDYMASALGKTGVISKVYPDGDLRVHIKDKTWTFNPLCLKLVSHSTDHTSSRSEGWQEKQLPSSYIDQSCDSSCTEQLVKEAAQGNVHFVQQYLSSHPEKVDVKSAGKTCLQVACHQGHLDLVRYMLSIAAATHIADDDGDTALHYASFGNQPEILELLLKKRADINAVNKCRCTPLHVAVNKQHAACVKLLLKYKCDVNIQDSYGDTALHDAIGKSSIQILEMLANFPQLDISVCNKRGFNVLHHSALKGNNYAAEKLILRARHYVDLCKDDGFSALHLSALNGHYQVVETLITLGQAQIDIRNNRKQTPLLLAASQGHCGVVELLVKSGADITAQDEELDTALHLALSKSLSVLAEFDSQSPEISNILDDIAKKGFRNNVSLALSCFLVSKGADVSVINKKGKSPLGLIYDSKTIDVLQSYVPPSVSSSGMQLDMDLKSLDLAAESLRIGPHHDGETPPTMQKMEPLVAGNDNEPVDCIVCLETRATVHFEPCGHVITCEDCASRVKKCFKCSAVILSKILPDGRVLSSKVRYPSSERLRYLEKKISEIEEANSCTICLENRKTVAFLCGHSACALCADTLKTCHMCRRVITKKINLY